MSEYYSSVDENLRRSGCAVIGPILDDEHVELITSKIVQHLESQPRSPEYKLKIPKLTDIKDTEYKMLKSTWEPDFQSGLIVAPAAFNLKYIWRIREAKFIVDLFKYLLESDDIRVNVDSYYAYLPGAGGCSNLYWNSNPRSWNFSNRNIVGLLCVNETTYEYIPESHTESFRDSFIRKYPLLSYGHVTTISPTYDPWKLYGKIESITVPVGSMILFDTKTLRKNNPNNTNKIKFMIPLVFSRTNEALQSDKDRVESYLSGKGPKKLSDGSIFSYMPTSWKCHPKLAQIYQERLPEDARSFRLSVNGQKLAQLIEPEPEDYIPPTLSKAGYKILWGKSTRPTEEDLSKMKNPEVKHFIKLKIRSTP